MLAMERKRRIVNLVNERGSIRVTEISRLFEVTPETARRDLDLLENEGKLRRSHGGAVRINDEQTDVPYVERESINAAEKMEVAKHALSLIEPGDTIVLDASSTSSFLARVIPDMPITILTNSIRVIQEIGGKEDINVIATGGIFRTKSMSFVGPLAEEVLGKYHVDKAFISCKGIHLTHGISDSNELQALVKQKMAAIADKTYLLADHSKFGVRAFAHAFTFEEIDCVITDFKLSDEIMNSYYAAGIQIQKG